jgi:nucleotide-binding universal stress UspA family protein
MVTFGPHPGVTFPCRPARRERMVGDMDGMCDGPVVVGFDSSPAAARALDAAAEQASALGLPLQVVHVYSWPILYASLANIPFAAEQWRPSPEAVAAAESAAARLRAIHPELSVSVSVLVGKGGEQLVAASQRASLLAVGDTGARGVSGLLSGSVTAYVMAHAHAPVMVVRNVMPRGRTGAEVCVGVDGTPSSLDALRVAAAWARRLGATVRALHAIGSHSFDEPAPEFGGHTSAERRLRDWVSEALGDDATVDTAVVRRDPVGALIAASTAARLVVVGSRHRGELASMVLGSVGHSLIRRAACPVVIVPGPPAGTQPVPATVAVAGATS